MREITASEHEYLEELLASMPTTTMRLLEGAQNALVLWAASMFGIVILWLFVAWGIRLVFDADYGWGSFLAMWVYIIGGSLCAVYALVSSVNWIRSWKDLRPLIKSDLLNGKVDEENIIVTEVMRFQEQEHGGLIYFLRTKEDRVFVLYDEESQDLGVNGDDPLKSSFSVGNLLNVVRAPSSNFVIKRDFSGSPIQFGEPIDMIVQPELWPESESWCSIPWDELEAHFSEAASLK